MPAATEPSDNVRVAFLAWADDTPASAATSVPTATTAITKRRMICLLFRVCVGEAAPPGRSIDRCRRTVVVPALSRRMQDAWPPRAENLTRSRKPVGQNRPLRILRGEADPTKVG